MKSRKRLSKLPEEWEVIPDTHEGIVTQEEFDTVQRLMTSRRREQNAGGFENIFSGVIKCADCGYAMRAASANRRKRPDIIDCVQYTCNNYGRYGNVMCTAHSIEARDLFNAVLADINRFADMAVNDEKAVRAIEKRLTETDQSRARALEKEQRKLNKRLAELDRLFSSLYEDKVMERITERNFEMMSGKYQKEQLEIEARLREVTETLNDSYEKSQGVRDFLSLIRNYQGLKELDATIINALIDKILVSEREKLTDGTVRQEIKIYYKFIGFVGELHITPTKRWTALKPKNCTVCGVEYVPRSAISKYCPECRKRIRKVQGTETKRRSRERNRQACIELSAKNDRLMMLNDVETGKPLAYMSGNLLSSMRTGAMPGLAAKLLARNDSKVLALVGPGVICRSSLRAIMSQRFDIDTIKIKGSSPTSANAIKMKEYIEENYPQVKNIVLCKDMEETLKDADIITEAVSCKEGEWPEYKREWLKPGALVISTSTFNMEHKSIVDLKKVIDNYGMYENYAEEDNVGYDENGNRLHTGCMGEDFVYMVQDGLIERNSLTTFGEIIRGKKPGRESDDEIILVSIEGMPTEDVAWAYECYTYALVHDIGTKLKVWDHPYAF